VARAIGDRLSEGHHHFNLALLRRTQGDLLAARQHARTAANILAELGRESEAERARKLLDEVG